MLMRTPPRWVRPKLLKPPGFIVPCRPVLSPKVPPGDDWIHELKHDGFRIIVRKDGERVHPGLATAATGRTTSWRSPRRCAPSRGLSRPTYDLRCFHGLHLRWPEPEPPTADRHTSSGSKKFGPALVRGS